MTKERRTNRYTSPAHKGLSDAQLVDRARRRVAHRRAMELESMSIEKIEERIHDAEDRAYLAEQVSTLTDAEKAVYNGLPPDAKAAYLVSTPAERKVAIETENDDGTCSGGTCAR